MAKGDCQLSFICSQSQKGHYKLAAKIAGVSMAAWIRMTLNIQALKTIQRQDRAEKVCPDVPNSLGRDND